MMVVEEVAIEGRKNHCSPGMKWEKEISQSLLASKSLRVSGFWKNFGLGTTAEEAEEEVGAKQSDCSSGRPTPGKDIPQTLLARNGTLTSDISKPWER
jgi:hypothetical protein